MITNTYYHYCSNLVYNNDRLSTILFDGGYASLDEGNGNIEEVNHCSDGLPLWREPKQTST